MVGGGSSGKGSGPPGRVRWVVGGGGVVALGHIGVFDRGHIVPLVRGHMGLFVAGHIFAFVLGHMGGFVLGHILVMGGIGPPGGDGANPPLRLVGVED